MELLTLHCPLSSSAVRQQDLNSLNLEQAMEWLTGELQLCEAELELERVGVRRAMLLVEG